MSSVLYLISEGFTNKIINAHQLRGLIFRGSIATWTCC